MGPPLRGARRCAQRARSAALARRRGAVCHRRTPVVAAAGAESARGPVGSGAVRREPLRVTRPGDRKSTRLNSSHTVISYAVFCLKKKKKKKQKIHMTRRSSLRRLIEDERMKAIFE